MVDIIYNVRKILTPSFSLPLLAKTVTPLQRGLSAIAEHLVLLPRCIECRRGLAMRILSVCPSVCPSVKRVICDKTKESCARILIPHERPFTLVF